MFEKIYLSIVIFLFGLIVGSFDNVAIYRIPEGKSLVSPRSFCPDCKTTIAWYDNIPLISYIVLRGRCRHCGKNIPIRYPLVELTSGLLFLAVFAKLDFSWSTLLFPYLYMVTVLIIVSVIDLERQIIPNKVMYPSIAVGIIAMGLVALVEGSASILWDSLKGFAVGGVPLALLALILPRGMGMGDAKLAAFTGIFLGWKSQLIAFFFSFLLGSIAGVAMMMAGKKDRKSRIPFGPFLAAGALISLFWGSAIWNLYRGLF
jgi:leader peptidase (prepilin peptidase)/N-methyltransferase